MTATAYPHTHSIKIIRFWLAFAAGLLCFGYLLLLGGYTFQGNYMVQLFGFALAVTVCLSWLIWRWVIWRDRLPRTGLEWAIGLGLLAVLASLAASPDPRQGLWRAGWIFGYALLFYFFLNLLHTDLDRWGLLAGAIAVAGAALAQAASETIQWYQTWFAASGGFALPPQPYRFTGLLTASTPLMALANLFVPVLLLTLWRIRLPVVRVLAGLWLVIYAFDLPFSSSRGAWLGLAVAIAVGGIFWAWNQRPWRAVLTWPRRRLVLAGLALVALAVTAGFLGLRFLVTFASSATHGGDPFGTSGREQFWLNALQIWWGSPWFGAGPGRFGFAYLAVQQTVPPGFWPMHAHNLFLTTLAELGGVGLAAGLILLGALLYWSWRTFRRTNLHNQAWTAALLAGLAGLLVQQFFDDLSSWMAVMVPAVFLLAWIGTNPDGALPTFRRASLGWLALPTILLVAVCGYGLWAYRPMIDWLAYARAGDWRQAAEQVSQSAARDPDFHYYATEAGLVWAWEWQYQQDPLGLENARNALRKALALEPAVSWTWANLAILDAAAGDPVLSLQHMQQAARLAPGMGAYAFQLGKLYESSGKPELALVSYLRALTRNPAWAELEAWRETPLRQQALAAWQATRPAQPAGPVPYWQQARQAISSGQFETASRRLAQAGLLGEPELDIARTAVLLADARGDPGAARQARERVGQLTTAAQMNLDPLLVWSYQSFLSNRDGTGILAVPGLVP